MFIEFQQEYNDHINYFPLKVYMDLYQFNISSHDKRASLVWEHGTFICFRDEEDNQLVLYDMGNFYAEVWYDLEMNVIKLVRGFKSLHCLEPYLESIKLNNINY